MPIKRKRQDGKVEYYGRVTLPGGKRKEKRFDRKKDALAWEILARQKLKESTTQTRLISLHSLMTKHLDALRANGAAKGTLADKRLCFRELLAMSGVKPTMLVTDVRYETVRSFLDEVAMHKSSHRANTYRKHVVRLWNWGVKARLLEGPCAWDIEMYKVDKGEKYVPPESDFWDVYAVADQALTSHGVTIKAPHRKRMLLAYLHTAARRSEIFRLKWTDVDFDNRRIRLWTRKRRSGLEADWIPMTADLLKHLRVQRLETGFREHVFVARTTDRPYVYANDLVKNMCGMATKDRLERLKRITWADVDMHGHKLRLMVHTRSEVMEERWFFLPPDALEGLRNLSDHAGEELRVFSDDKYGDRLSGEAKLLARIGEVVEVKPFGFHSIRHLSASILAKAGVDLPTIQRILRHKRATTTSEYLHSLVSAPDAIDHAFGCGPQRGQLLKMTKASG